MPTVLLRVYGMGSPEDEARLAAALRAERGVFDAVVDYAEGCAEIDCDDDVITVEQLVRVVEAAGLRAILGG
jgi:copper chaperone CopZ